MFHYYSHSQEEDEDQTSVEMNETDSELQQRIERRMAAIGTVTILYPKLASQIMGLENVESDSLHGVSIIACFEANVWCFSQLNNHCNC